MSNNRVSWLSADEAPESFPDVNTALTEPDGLLAAGGDLSSERLLYAYRHGIFPWYDDGQPLLWWSPNPRCVFLPGDYRVATRFRRELRATTCEIRVNTAFAAVIRACAGPRRSEQGTWITRDMLNAYQNLHELGWAHSIEVWHSNELCGGLYGIAIGKAFFGESMFSERTNTSKMALLFLANHLQRGDFRVLDCQVSSSHLMGLGARSIKRPAFLELLNSSCDPAHPFSNWADTPLSCSEMIRE